MEDPAFHHSQPATGQRAPARERRWWQSPEDGRQAEQMVRGQCDLRGHSSSRAGTWSQGFLWLVMGMGHPVHLLCVTDLTTHSKCEDKEKGPA